MIAALFRWTAASLKCFQRGPDIDASEVLDWRRKLSPQAKLSGLRSLSACSYSSAMRLEALKAFAIARKPASAGVEADRTRRWPGSLCTG